MFGNGSRCNAPPCNKATRAVYQLLDSGPTTEALLEALTSAGKNLQGTVLCTPHAHALFFESSTDLNRRHYGFFDFTWVLSTIYSFLSPSLSL